MKMKKDMWYVAVEHDYAAWLASLDCQVKKLFTSRPVKYQTLGYWTYIETDTQDLRRKVLPQWLPPIIEIRLPFVGINIALPLVQLMRAIQEYEDISGSDLPVAIASTADGKEKNSGV